MYFPFQVFSFFFDLKNFLEKTLRLKAQTRKTSSFQQEQNPKTKNFFIYFCLQTEEGASLALPEKFH